MYITNDSYYFISLYLENLRFGELQRPPNLRPGHWACLYNVMIVSNTALFSYCWFNWVDYEMSTWSSVRMVKCASVSQSVRFQEKIVNMWTYSDRFCERIIKLLPFLALYFISIRIPTNTFLNRYKHCCQNFTILLQLEEKRPIGRILLALAVLTQKAAPRTEGTVKHLKMAKCHFSPP